MKYHLGIVEFNKSYAVAIENIFPRKVISKAQYLGKKIELIISQLAK